MDGHWPSLDLSTQSVWSCKGWEPILGQGQLSCVPAWYFAGSCFRGVGVAQKWGTSGPTRQLFWPPPVIKHCKKPNRFVVKSFESVDCQKRRMWIIFSKKWHTKAAQDFCKPSMSQDFLQTNFTKTWVWDVFFLNRRMHRHLHVLRIVTYCNVLFSQKRRWLWIQPIGGYNGLDTHYISNMRWMTISHVPCSLTMAHMILQSFNLIPNMKHSSETMD